MDELPEPPPETDTVTQVAPITRAPDWQRISADTALFFALGHDVEIAFTVGGPSLVEVKTTETAEREELDESYRLKNLIEEAVRVRMPPVAATALAFNIIAKQASSGLFEKAKLQAQFEQIIELYESSELVHPDE